MTRDRQLTGVRHAHDPYFIMVVDDRTAARNLLLGLARRCEDNVSAEGYSGAKEAIQRALEKTPDLIITDYHMPDMNGIEFVRLMRATPSLADTPVLMITISDDQGIRHRALEAGVSDFMIRPIDPIECRTRCRNLLLQRRTKMGTST